MPCFIFCKKSMSWILTCRDRSRRWQWCLRSWKGLAGKVRRLILAPHHIYLDGGKFISIFLWNFDKKKFCVVRHLRMPPSCCCRSRWRFCRDGWRRWCRSPSTGRRQTSSSRFAEKRLLHQIVCFQLIFSAPMHSSHECPVGKNLNFCTGSNLL